MVIKSRAAIAIERWLITDLETPHYGAETYPLDMYVSSLTSRYSPLYSCPPVW